MEINLNRAINLIEKKERKYKNERFAQYGLKSMHHDYLKTVQFHPGISQEEIAEEVVADKANVARQLACLEKKGYITRHTCQKDSRRVEVYLTEAGKAVVQETKKVMDAMNEKLTEGINEEESLIFNEILKKMMHNIENL